MFKKFISLLLAIATVITAFSLIPAASAEDRGDIASGAAAQEQTYVSAAEAVGEEQSVVSVSNNTEVAELVTEPAQSATEAPAIDYPVIKSIENLSEGAKITWERYGNNTSYRVYYRKAAVYNGTWDEKYSSSGWTRLATVNGNSYTHKDVKDAEIGIYTVRAVDTNGNFTSNFFSQGWENCFYAAPQISSINFDESGVHISWSYSWRKHGVHNGERYIVYRRTADTSWKRVNENAASGFTDTTTDPRVTYIYTLRMVNEDGSRFISGYNSGKTISFNAYPYVTSVENLENGARLTWLKYSGAAKYRVYYKTSTGWTRIAQVSGTSYTDTSVKAGETRIYTVRAIDSSDAFVSNYNTEGWSNRFYSAPVIRTLTNTTDGVKITWDRASGAQLYRVYRKTNGGWVRLTQTDASEYIDTKAASGTSYTYTLRMVSADTESFMSGYNSGKNITFVSAPVIKAVTNTKDGAKLTWDKVAGADHYRIYYRNDSGWNRLASKYLTEYTDTSVKNGEQREYTIRCLDSKDNFVSDFYRSGYTNTFYAPPVLNTMTVEGGAVNLSWNTVDTSLMYRVYRRTEGGSWERLANVTGGNYTDASAKKGVVYYYTVRMITSDGTGFLSDYLSGNKIVVCDTPQITSATYSSEGVVLKWNAVKNADYYRVYYKKSEGGWTRLTTLSGTSYTDVSAKDGDTRLYTVRCSDKQGNLNSDFNREGTAFTYYAAPKINSVKYSGGHYTISWSKTEGVAGYRIYRRNFGDSDWTAIANMYDGSSFTDNSSQSGKICAFTLRAQDASGAVISYFVPDNPYYKNGSIVNGTFSEGGSTYRFISGQPAKGYFEESGKLCYYNNGKRNDPTNYYNKVSNSDVTRSRWLYELMKASGSTPNVSSGNTAAVFELARKRGIISSYSDYDMYQSLTRRFVAQTMVSALNYPNRSVGYTTDISLSDSDLSTIAYYGYFIPDTYYRLYPDAYVTRDEFAYLLTEINLYHQLKGKNVLGFGDSIMYGAGNDDMSVTQIIAEKYGMHYTDYSVKGAAVGNRSGRGHIPDQVRKAISAGKKADLILFNGGTNDMNHTSLGTINSGYDMSSIKEATYTDGMEKMLWMMTENWKNTPIIYIRPHNMDLGSDEKERIFGDRGIAIAEKWRAAAIDLYNDSYLNTENVQMANRYTLLDPDDYYQGDTIHPTALGYAEFYLPPITDVLSLTYN